MTCWGCWVQDLFVGAWQQANPDIDQVPFTFPPVYGPSKLGRGKKAQMGAFKNKGPRTNGGQYARLKQHGRGFMVHEANMKLPPPKKMHAKSVKGKQHGVSTAEYAMALDQEL